MEPPQSSLPVNNEDGDNGPKPSPQQKGPQQQVAGNGNKWIAPGIFGILTTVVIVISALNGSWHELWVEWVLIPAGIIAATIGIFELCKRALGWKTQPSIIISIFAFVLCSGFAIWMYRQSVTQWRPPLLPNGTAKITVIFGQDSSSEGLIEMSCPIEQFTNGPFNPVRLATMDVAKLYVKDQRLYVQTRLPSHIHPNPFESNLGTNQLIPFLVDNRLDSKIPPTWDRNFNSNAFEIVDEQNMPMLQEYYKRPDVVVIRGIFVNNNNGCAVLFSHPALYAGFLPKDMTNIPDRKALFKYPSSLHPGELEE